MNDNNSRGKNVVQDPTKMDPDEYLYFNPPKSNKNLSFAFDTVFQPVYDSLKDEFEGLNIQFIVKKFSQNITEFYALTNIFRGKTTLEMTHYMSVLDNIINVLCNLYDVKIDMMNVERQNYAPSTWGKTFWMFLHSSSILITHAHQTGKINGFLKFNFVVYNIDVILPCSVCEAHYLSIKKTPLMLEINSKLGFGLLISHTHYFHNIISSNINRSRTDPRLPLKKTYLTPDFAYDYKCICGRDETMINTMDYIPTIVDWQPTIHVIITTLIATYCNVAYSKISILLKEKLYNDNKAFNIQIPTRGCDDKQIESVLGNNDTVVNNQPMFDLPFKKINKRLLNDYAIESFTGDDLRYCLRKVLLLQFDQTPLKEDDIIKNTCFVESYAKFFHTFPHILIKLILSINDDQERNIVYQKLKSLIGIILNFNTVN